MGNMKIKKAASLNKIYENVIEIFWDEVVIVTNLVTTRQSLRNAFETLFHFIVILLFIKQVFEKIMGMSLPIARESVD